MTYTLHLRPGQYREGIRALWRHDRCLSANIAVQCAFEDRRQFASRWPIIGECLHELVEERVISANANPIITVEPLLVRDTDLVVVKVMPCGTRHCINCGDEFRPTGNGHVVCDICGIRWNGEQQNKRNRRRAAAKVGA